jgi:prepilin-type processing-associated H-X9-DG protein
MKTRGGWYRRFETSPLIGFTRVELLVVIMVLAVLALLVLPFWSTARSKAHRISCVSCLKQIALAFRIYANDNDERYPTDGWSERADLSDPILQPATIFGGLSEELSTPYILACPADVRKRARSWTSLTQSNVSYFIGLDAASDHPMSLLAGDRNLTINGDAVRPGVIPIATNTILEWTAALHRNRGNVAFGDGSVQPSTSTRLRELVRHQEIGTNWLSIP